MLGTPEILGAVQVPLAAGVGAVLEPLEEPDEDDDDEPPEEVEPDDPEEGEEPDPEGAVGVSRLLLLENSQPPTRRDPSRIESNADLLMVVFTLVLFGMVTLGVYTSVPARTFLSRKDGSSVRNSEKQKETPWKMQDLRQGCHYSTVPAARAASDCRGTNRRRFLPQPRAPTRSDPATVARQKESFQGSGDRSGYGSSVA